MNTHTEGRGFHDPDQSSAKQAYRRSAGGWGLSPQQALKQAILLSGIATLGIYVAIGGSLFLFLAHTHTPISVAVGFIGLVLGMSFAFATAQPVPSLLHAWYTRRHTNMNPVILAGRVTAIWPAPGLLATHGDRFIIRIESSPGHYELYVIGPTFQEPEISSKVRISYLPGSQQVIDVSHIDDGATPSIQ